MNIYKRQTNLVKPDQLDFPILLIGCGGTGSWAGIALAKMGCTNIALVDFDEVEPHNIASQTYRIIDFATSIKKVYTLKSQMQEMNDQHNINFRAFSETFEEFFEKSQKHFKPITLPPSEPYPYKFPVVICAIDSMDERIKLWDIIKKRNDVELFLDPRIGGELLRLYAVDPLDNKAVAFYESQLYPSSKADPLPCGSRQIVYTTMFTGALIANYVKKYAKKEPIRAETIMDFSTMNLI